MGKEKAICEHCGKSFSYYRSTLRGKDAKFCSLKCYHDSHPKAWNKGKIEYSKCLYCGKQIRGWRKYCSQECYYKDVDVSKHLPKVGTGKDNPFFGKKHTKKTKMKMSKNHVEVKYWLGKERTSMMGDKHWNWKGGIKRPHKRNENDTTERTNFYYTVRKMVLERDDYTCQFCGERGVALHVDHIQSWSEHVDQRFNMDNCRTLCMACHYKLTFGKQIPVNIKNWGAGFGKTLMPLYKE